MTPDERNMLTDLANKIAQTPAPPRDAEAEEFIRTRIGNRPDALYLMTQTVLIQNMALQQAQQQLQTQQARPSSGGSFLGGSGSPQQPAQPSYAAPQYQPQYTVAPMSGSTVGSGGGGGFLRGAAQTAAGVAAGALAFEGIKGLFNSFEHPGYGGGGSGFLGDQGRETVVNNYYDSPAGDDRGNRDDYQDRFNDGPNVDNSADNVYDNSADVDDSAQYDDSSDTGSDDSGDTFA